MHAKLAMLSLLCLSACHKSAPREMTEDEKWEAALAAGPTDPASLKEFVVVPLAAVTGAAAVDEERPEVSFYAPLPDGWTRATEEVATAADEKFISANGKARVNFRIRSGDPEQLANTLAKEYADSGIDVGVVNVSADGAAADFTFVNRIAYDLAFPDKPPVYGWVSVRRPIGWPPQLVLSAEGHWLDNQNGDYGAVWNIMEGVVTQ